MRTLTSTLTAAQQASSIDAKVQIILTWGMKTYSFLTDRILSINHIEESFNQRATVLLDNSDGFLTDVSFEGYKGRIRYGATTGAGVEYSACAPLWVISQQLRSSEGRLVCELSLAGIFNLMAEERADRVYGGWDDDTRTLKTLINQIIAATPPLYPFDHCKSYEVVWDSSDAIIDTYQPKETFRISLNETRLEVFRKLLDLSQCVTRVEEDGKIHIFVPTTSGASYDYKYSLDTGHTFFSKIYRKRLVIPNYIFVTSPISYDPLLWGWAQDTDSVAAIGEMRYFQEMSLESNQQATTIAQSILSKFQLNAEKGAAYVPMNAGAEVYDYVKVSDSRQNDYRIGTIGFLSREYRSGTFGGLPRFAMEFRFGKVAPFGLARTMPMKSVKEAVEGTRGEVKGLTLDLLYELITNMWAIIEEIIQYLDEPDVLKNFVYVTGDGDIVINPKAGRLAHCTGDLSMAINNLFGLTQKWDADSRLFWFTNSGKRDHAFCPDTAKHGKVGDSTYPWLEGHFVNLDGKTVKADGVAIALKQPTILIPDDAVLPVANGATLSVVDGTNFSYDCLGFDPAIEKIAYWEWFLSSDYLGEKTIIDIYWISNGAGDVKFGLSILGRQGGEKWDSPLDAEITVVQTNAGAGILNKAQISAFVPSWSASDIILLKLARKATDAADTIDANDALVLKVVLSYQTAIEKDWQQLFTESFATEVPPNWQQLLGEYFTSEVPVNWSPVFSEPWTS